MGKYVVIGGPSLAAILLMSFCVFITVSGIRALNREGLPENERPSSAGQQLPGQESPYVPLARLAASNVGLPPDLFVRQIQVESGFNPTAVSPAGAVGIAQFLPDTAAGLGINPWNPQDALTGAARLMASYVQSYQGDYAKALAAYNAGSGGVSQALATCRTQQRPWDQCLPLETRLYLQKILWIEEKRKGEKDEIRTRSNREHHPVLYQFVQQRSRSHALCHCRLLFCTGLYWSYAAW
jgi:soluble lytic murein transglycosylase-like protein